MPGHQLLPPAQERLLQAWFPGYAVVADHSWGLVDTTVLQIRHDGRDVVVKAGGPGNHHLGREIEGRRRWLGPWLRTGSVGVLLHASEDDRILAVEHLPGRLVQDVPGAAHEPDVHRQAGRLLAAFHAQDVRDDADHETEADARALRWLDQPHRLPAATVAALRKAIATHAHDAVALVPTHGDWQPRNWLVHEGTVRVIDLGRAAWRPAMTDLARLARQQWEGRPDLEEAFLDGYGADPRDPAVWRATLLREAVGTAVWAHQVGDADFEQQGHRMVDQALALYA